MAATIFTADQIAPCGMNCGACSSYLALTHGIPRKRGKITCEEIYHEYAKLIQ